MAREIIDLELPSGEVVELDIDSSWDDATIREKAAAAGLFGETGDASVPKNKDEDDMPAFDEDAKPETEAKPKSLTERFKRQQELGVRATVEGVAGFPLMIGDAANTALNFIPGVELGMPSQIVRDALPLAKPETAGERLASTIIQAGTGTAAGIKTAAKHTTGAVKRFMTEEAGMQLAVGTAAGAGIGVGAEADLGPVGLIFMGLVGGLAGGAGAKTASKGFAKWADGRATSDKPVTLAEVKEQAELDGHAATNEELRTLQESLEEMRTAARADEAIAKMRPKSSDPIEVKRAKQAAIRKMGGDKKGDLPVETRRVLETLERKDIAKMEAKVRAVEAQKAQTAPEMRQLNARTKPESASNVITDDSYRPSKMSTFGNAVIDRITNVSPVLGMAVRRVSQRSATRTTDDIRNIDKFYGSSEFKRLKKGEARELDRAFLNGDVDGANAIMGRIDGLTELYAENVSKLLGDIQRLRTAGGLDGFVENFHPRAVIRLKALQKTRGKEVAGKVEQALMDKRRQNKAAGKGDLTENEVAGIINQQIGGRPVKVLKDRRINEISQKDQKYYATSRDSLIDYLHNHHSSVATRDFFKHNLGATKELGQTIDDVELAKMMAIEMKAGRMTGAQADEIVPLLAAQFGVSRQAVGGFQRRIKNVFTAGVLANPLSTVTQLGDIAPLMSKFGVRQTLMSLFGKKKIDVYDLGVRELSKDARTAHGTARLVREGLQAVGFDKLDKVMANTGSNAAFSKWAKLARKNPKATEARLRKAFGNDAAQLTDDLANYRMTDDVKTWLLSEMGDIRPVAREDMPLGFQQNPNGRYKYSLLSWTLKQANFLRNSAMRDFKAGKKTKATKDFVKFLALMGLANGSAQSIKDWVRGKDIEPGSAFVSGALSIGMSGKYMVDALERNTGLAALGAIIPFLGIMGDFIQTSFNALMEGEPAEMLKAFPTLRNFVSILEGDLPAVLLAAPLMAADALIGDAEAGTHAAGPQQKLGQREQAQVEAELRDVRGQTALPEGTLELKPGLTGDDIDQARAQMATRNEIEREQAQRQEAVVPKNTQTAEMIKKHETSRTKSGGWDKEGAVWRPYGSIEGGTPTIAHGHKLTKDEDEAGAITIGEDDVLIRDGLSDEQAETLLAQDMQIVDRAIDRLVTVELSEGQRSALTSLIYNVGVNSFAGSKARKGLNDGDMDKFRKEAFSVKEGWTHVNGKVNKGLVKRRKAEERMFFS